MSRPNSSRPLTPSTTYGTYEYVEYQAKLVELQPEPKVEAYVSEFVGTFFLVLTVGFNVLQKTALAPISIGAILMAMIFATGKVSGGHFNPAVTLGVYWRGKLDSNDVFGYIAVQLLGGLVAGLVYLAVLGATFSLGHGVGYGLGSVLVVEVLFTAALVFVVLNVATTTQDDGNWYYGLAIGLTVMASAFAIGPISGCCLNPAVAFGVMLSNFLHTGHIAVIVLAAYSVAPIIGAGLAVLFFQVVREQEYNVPTNRAVNDQASSFNVTYETRNMPVIIPRSNDSLRSSGTVGV